MLLFKINLLIILNLKRFNLLLIILLFALFASIFSLQKRGLIYAEPFFLIGCRMMFAGFFIILIIFLFNRKKLKINSKHFLLFVYLAVFNIYLTNSFEIWGLKNMSSSKACLIYSLSPFFTAFLAFFILKEKLTLKKILGMLIGFLGLLPIIYFKTLEEIKVENILFFSFSEISLLLAVFFSVLGWIFLKKILTLGYSFLIANGFSMFLGGVLILCNSYFLGEKWTPFPIINMEKFLFYTIITCIISNIICYNLFGYLLKYFSATFMTFSGLMTPFFAAFFGWFFLNEKITSNFFLSIFIFFIGLVIFFLEEKK